MLKRALVIGGSNGIGLALTCELIKKNYNCIYIIDRCEPEIELNDTVKFSRFNLLNDDYSLLESIKDIDTLIITAGFGRIVKAGTRYKNGKIFLVGARSVAMKGIARL